MNLQDINIRDPFILPIDGKYYLYGSRGPERNALPLGLDVYVSDDLETWSEPIVVFTDSCPRTSATTFPMPRELPVTSTRFIAPSPRNRPQS